MPFSPSRVLILLMLCCLILAPCPAARAADDILIADFEGKDYDQWKATGEAFGPGPARGALAGQMNVSGFEGKGLVNSFYKGDASTGELISPAFKIERPFINFLIGGGNHPGKTCIDLLLDGKVVRTASGPNDQPGGSEMLAWKTWDVKELIGQSVTIRIVDKETGGWGHINIDQITQSDRKLQPLPARREILIDKRYLLLPVRTGAAKRRMKFTVDGKVEREFEIELAEGKAEFQVFADVAAWKGKTLAIEVSAVQTGPQALATIEQSDRLPEAEAIYREANRPQFHFTSRRGWLNDPNGLVYYKGEFHLFYQHNPYGKNWGNMHWGHAVSGDLFRWKEESIALYPAKFGDWAFSGSAVVDAANTSGFQTGSEKPLVLAYTSTGRGECIAYSNDRGRTWTEYAGNPVVKHTGRDPKLIWHEPSKQWVMAVYSEVGGKRFIAFHTSPDMKAWTFQSRIEGYFECPDLFELPVQGTDERLWVLFGADGRYALGQFDGKQFKPESGKHQLWYGNFYAAQTYSDAPDGRRIIIGWANGISFPGMPFNQQMSVPCDLTLRKTPDGARMFAEPVKELAGLIALKKNLGALTLREGVNTLEGTDGELLDAEVEFDLEGASEVGLTVRGQTLTYNVEASTLSIGKQVVKIKPVDGKLRLRMLVDRGSIEAYANRGAAVISLGAKLDETDRKVSLHARGKGVKATEVEVRVLKSAWE